MKVSTAVQLAGVTLALTGLYLATSFPWVMVALGMLVVAVVEAQGHS